MWHAKHDFEYMFSNRRTRKKKGEKGIIIHWTIPKEQLEIGCSDNFDYQWEDPFEFEIKSQNNAEFFQIFDTPKLHETVEELKKMKLVDTSMIRSIHDAYQTHLSTQIKNDKVLGFKSKPEHRNPHVTRNNLPHSLSRRKGK